MDSISAELSLEFILIMLVSGPMKTQCIFCPAELIAMMTIIALSGHVMNFYMVPQIRWLLTLIFTTATLPKSIFIFPHLVPHIQIYIANRHLETLRILSKTSILYLSIISQFDLKVCVCYNSAVTSIANPLFNNTFMTMV